MKRTIVINSDSLRSLCIERMWCTGMTIEEYGEMLNTCGVFKTMEETEEIISHIADEIIRTSHRNSSGHKDIVMTSIFNNCVSVWFREADDND